MAGSAVPEADLLRHYTRRKHPRFNFLGGCDWDFFTSPSGGKSGIIDNVSQGGCLLRTDETIDHRRWVRILVKEARHNIWFTSVGRIMRREDKMESWDQHGITLYRYGIEFVHPLNQLILEQIKDSCSACASCGDPSATIPDLFQPNTLYCVLCHLRKACHNLLVQDGLDSA